MEEFDYKKFIIEHRLTINSRLLMKEDEQLSLFPDSEFEEPSQEPTPAPLEANVEMVKDDYLARKSELDAMGPEKNKYAQEFAKWAKTKIGNVNFGDKTMVSFHLEKLFGISKYSNFPLPDGKKENFLPVEVLKAWKSSNDPKYIGLLVYMDRILSPQKNLNESILAGAASVALGILGVVGLVKGLSVAKRLAGETLDFAAGKALDKLNANIDARKKEELLSKIKPIADKFSNDEQLKAMYDSLPARSSSVSKQAVASNAERDKQLRNIAAYIKSKLTEDEMEHFEDVSKLLRTGTV